jgi:hypothetical protein
LSLTKETERSIEPFESGFKSFSAADLEGFFRSCVDEIEKTPSHPHHDLGGLISRDSFIEIDERASRDRTLRVHYYRDSGPGNDGTPASGLQWRSFRSPFADVATIVDCMQVKPGFVINELVANPANEDGVVKM